MWSEPPSRRRALAALGALGGLAACGFAPAYGPGGSASVLRNQVLPDKPGDRFAFLFASRIEDRLGPAGEDAAYSLGYGLPLRTVETAVTGTGSPRRLALEGVARFSLRRRGGGVVTSGAVSAFTAFSDTGTSVAVRSARADAERRLAVILADQVVTQLLARAPSFAGPGAPAP